MHTDPATSLYRTHLVTLLAPRMRTMVTCRSSDPAIVESAQYHVTKKHSVVYFHAGLLLFGSSVTRLEQWGACTRL